MANFNPYCTTSYILDMNMGVQEREPKTRCKVLAALGTGQRQGVIVVIRGKKAVGISGLGNLCSHKPGAIGFGSQWWISARGGSGSGGG